MEQETLFTASKWDILKMLARGPKSPLQLAKLSNTSVANVSQQLRLLEMAGLVDSKRISNREKGQPRQLYSLVGNHSFLIASGADFVEKKLLKISDYNKIILRIWFIEDVKVHYFLEKAFWHVESYLPDIKGLFFDKKSAAGSELAMLVVSDNLSMRKDIKKLQSKNIDGQKREVVFVFKSVSELKSLLGDSTRYYVIYDPQGLFKSDKADKKSIEDNKAS
jgi:DNA-binding transcriptional ArsR family regulator